jgi:hypothetical protein
LYEQGKLFKSLTQSEGVARFSQVLLTQPAPLDATVHDAKKPEQPVSSIKLDGAFAHVLSLQAPLPVVSQKQSPPEAFLVQANVAVILSQVVFVMHPPPDFVIQFFFGKYVSQSEVYVKSVGAFSQVLSTQPLPLEFTVQVSKN